MSINVLILEDRPEEARLLAIELRRSGIDPQLTYAQNELEFLAALSRPLDLILANYSVPGLDAMRALQLLHERGLEIPFIVVSGSANVGVAVECIKQGASDYVLKDQLTHLQPAITQTIEQQHRRMRHEGAERALLESEQQVIAARLAGIVDSTLDAIISIDESGRVIVFNSAAEQIFGCPAATVLGQPIDQFVPVRAQAAHRQHIHAFGEAGVTNRTMHGRGISMAVRANGEEFPIDAAISQIVAAGQKIYTVTIRDISERKQAEAALRASEERFRVIFEMAPIGIVLCDLQGYIVDSNQTFQNLIGYSGGELRTMVFTQFVHPDDRKDACETFHKLVAGNYDHYSTERRYIHKNGQMIWGRPSASLVRNVEGMPQFSIVTIENITEQKEAEKALLRQTAFVQLLQAVAVAANQATSLEQALQTAVDQICTRIGWPVGHVYLAPEAGPHALASTSIWHLADPTRFTIFQTITEALPYAAIDDLPGRVLISGKPEWITDITAAPSVPRAKLTSDIGVRAGFAFPVLIGAEVAAVLEFFAAEAIEPDAVLLEIMGHIGTQLGRVVERTRADMAMRDSEERYRLIAENTGDIISLMDLDGRQIYISPACESLLGYHPSELVGRRIGEFIHPDDLPSVRQLWPSFQAGSGARTTLRYHHADGSWRWFEAHGTVLVQNGIRYILGVSRDVSQRRQTEEALRAAEAKYRTLVEQIPAIIYTAEINEQSSTLYVSPQIEPILGFSPEEWMADPDLWVEQLHPDDRARVLDLVGVAQASDAPVPAEYRSITRDGRVVWLQDAARVVRDDAGQPLFMQGITLDITERKVAEEAVRTSERLYRTLASNFPNGAVILFDRDLRFTIADGMGLGPAGYSSTAIEGKTLWDVFPPERVTVLEPLYRAALGGTTIVTELPVGDRVFETNILPVKNEQDEIFAGLIVSQDITERKHAEEALTEERALLARRVEERTADLSAANAELARAARLKDEFLASMSHELRTPLNAILGLSEALEEEVYGPLNDRQSKTLRSIEESGRHLLELINDILDLAKIGAGKLELDVEPVAIEPICQASLRLIKQAAQKKRITVEMAIDPAIGCIHVDARRLKQILVNLLSNAVKFTVEGGSIGLELTGDQARHVVQLSVWDTGIGIAEDQLPSLFQPFVQLDSRLARQYEGTGLGLALVYRMVEMHGGSIAVTSEPGVGSRFTIALPWYGAGADAGPALAQPAPLPEALTSSRLRRVLIVEDSPSATEQITRYLLEFGMTANTATHGADALVEAIETRPDLIILDLLLPDMAGWDVLTQLKAEPRTRAIPVVIVSVMDERSKASAGGAAGYLVKPYSRGDVQQLLSTLEEGQYQPSHQGVLAQSSVYRRNHAPPVLLLAEDNEANITTLSDYLAAHGYQVVVARNGAEAVVRAREAHPAIVLMDIQMPGMDGLEATRRIRADRDMPQMPIIALTALAMPGDRERCLTAGATDYLSKPIALKGLVAKLQAYLS